MYVHVCVCVRAGGGKGKEEDKHDLTQEWQQHQAPGENSRVGAETGGEETWDVCVGGCRRSRGEGRRGGGYETEKIHILLG